MKKKSKIKNKGSNKNRKLLFVLIIGFIGVFGLIAVKKINEQLNLPCANTISCIKDLSGEYENDVKAVFLGREIDVPQNLISPQSSLEKAVLGKTTEMKHIYVDLEAQALMAYEGRKKVMEFPVSTGKWGRTPVGTFKIWIKLVSTRMEGGSGNDYYNLPNVPYTMFYYNDDVAKSRGFSIHGAYWHNNFGYTMSHGCINMRPVDAKTLFEWAEPVSGGHTTYAGEENPGTLVTVYGNPL